MTDDLPRPAAEISQQSLDETAAAILAEDFETFNSHFLLPHRIRTFKGARMIESLDQMEVTFRSLCHAYKLDGVTDIVRNCIEAAYKGADTVEATHMTHLMNGLQRVIEPFPCFSVLKRDSDGRWKVARSDYAIPADTRHSRVLDGAGTPYTVQ